MIIRVYGMDVQMWHPRFLISIINANDRISWVKPADIGQSMVNLGHHLGNLVSNP
jgi:urease accessory protein UreE